MGTFCRKRRSSKGFLTVLIVVFVFLGYLLVEIAYRNGSYISAYSEAPVGEDNLLGGGFHIEANRAREIARPSSAVGLFTENRNLYFWWIGSNGQIIQETKFHHNNYGLLSKRDYQIKRGAHEFRIVVLGDEMTGSTTSDLWWPDVLEDELNSHSEMVNRFGEFRIFNFGHLDTGIQHWAYIFEKRAKAFDPDLVIVNLVEHVFNRRGPTIAPPSSWQYVSYTATGGGTAWTLIQCTGTGKRLIDQDCTTFNPIILWLDPSIARDPAAVSSIREQIINDRSRGRPFDAHNFIRPTAVVAAIDFLKRYVLKEAISSTAQAGRLNRGKGQPDKDREALAFARDNLRKIISEAPEVIILLNPWLHHSNGGQDFQLSYELVELDSSINIVDMRKFLPIKDSSTPSSWYASVAAEKWTPQGHKVYGKAVAEVVENKLMGKDLRLLQKPKAPRSD